MHYITAVRLSTGGTLSKHITRVMWLNGTNGKSDDTDTASMVKFIDVDPKLPVQVGGPDGPVSVIVVDPGNNKPKYLRTTPDDTPADNLLSLPRF